MFKIIGSDRKEYGPVSAGQIRQWIRENRANQQTMVCPEGGTEWVSLGKVAEFAPDFAGPQHSPPPPVAAQPPNTLPPLAPGGPLSGYGTHLSSGIQIFDCLRRGWKLVMDNLGLLVGATLLIFLIQSCMVWLIGWLASTIVQSFLQGPLLGGFYSLFLRRIRNQDAKLSDTFSGFGPLFIQLMVTQVVTSLLVALSAALFFVGFLILLAGSKSIIASSLGGMIGFIGLLPPIYLSVAWMYALPLVIDKKLDFSEAMNLSRQRVHAHWWSVFGLTIVGLLMAGAGILLLGVGFYVTMPAFLGAWMYAYEDLFGDAANAS